MQVWSGLNPDPQFENLEKGFMYIFMLCTKSLYFSGHSEEMGRSGENRIGQRNVE